MFNKIIAATVLTCFTISFIIREPLQAAIEKNINTFQFKSMVEDVLIPQNYGRITYSKNFNTKQVVINIQDLHCHEEVQRNISEIIKNLDDKYKLSRVYVEGAYGQVDTSCLSAIKDEAIKKDVLNNLINQGKITGSEYYSASYNRPTLLYGIEDENIHKANIVRLGKIIGKEEEFNEKIKELDKDIAYMKARYFNVSNKRLNNVIEKYHHGKLRGDKYFKILGKYIEKINDNPKNYNNIFTISMNNYPNIKLYLELTKEEKKLNYKKISIQIKELVNILKEKLPYSAYSALLAKTNNFSKQEELYTYLAKIARQYNLNLDINFNELDKFFNYIEKNQKLNPVAMLNEEKKLTEELRIGFSKNISELEISFLADFYLYFQGYLLNKLSAEDYEYFNKRFKKFQNLWGKYTIKNKVAELSSNFGLLNEFYKTNCQRNECFLNNISELKNTAHTNADAAISCIENASVLTKESEVIVIITGGFHSDGIKKLVEDKKISFITLTPNVTKDTTESSKAYEELAKYQAKILTNALALGFYTQLPTEERRVELTKALEKVDYKDLGKVAAKLKKIIGEEDIAVTFDKNAGTITIDGKTIKLEADENGKTKLGKNNLETLKEQSKKAVKEAYNQLKSAGSGTETVITSIFVPNIFKIVTRLYKYAAQNGEGLEFSIENDQNIDAETKEIIQKWPPALQRAFQDYKQRVKELEELTEEKEWLKIVTGVDLVKEFIIEAGMTGGNIEKGHSKKELQRLKDEILKNGEVAVAKYYEPEDISQARQEIFKIIKDNINYVKTFIDNRNALQQLDTILKKLNSGSIKFFLARNYVHSEDKYILGFSDEIEHESGVFLAYDLIEYLKQFDSIHKSNLLDEYVVHELLELTILKHNPIIDITKRAFQREESNPLGDQLNIFIKANCIEKTDDIQEEKEEEINKQISEKIFDWVTNYVNLNNDEDKKTKLMEIGFDESVIDLKNAGKIAKLILNIFIFQNSFSGYVIRHIVGNENAVDAIVYGWIYDLFSKMSKVDYSEGYNEIGIESLIAVLNKFSGKKYSSQKLEFSNGNIKNSRDPGKGDILFTGSQYMILQSGVYKKESNSGAFFINYTDAAGEIKEYQIETDKDNFIIFLAQGVKRSRTTSNFGELFKFTDVDSVDDVTTQSNNSASDSAIQTTDERILDVSLSEISVQDDRENEIPIERTTDEDENQPNSQIQTIDERILDDSLSENSVQDEKEQENEIPINRRSQLENTMQKNIFVQNLIPKILLLVSIGLIGFAVFEVFYSNWLMVGVGVVSAIILLLIRFAVTKLSNQNFIMPDFEEEETTQPTAMFTNNIAQMARSLSSSPSAVLQQDERSSSFSAQTDNRLSVDRPTDLTFMPFDDAYKAALKIVSNLMLEQTKDTKSYISHIVENSHLAEEMKKFNNNDEFIHLWFTDMPKDQSCTEIKKNFRFKINIGENVNVFVVQNKNNLVFYMDIPSGINEEDLKNKLTVSAVQAEEAVFGTDNTSSDENLTDSLREILGRQGIVSSKNLNFKLDMVIDHTSSNQEKVKESFSEEGLIKINIVSSQIFDSLNEDAVNNKLKNLQIRHFARWNMAKSKILQMDVSDIDEFREALQLFNNVGNSEMLVQWDIFKAAIDDKKTTADNIQKMLKNAREHGVVIYLGYKINNEQDVEKVKEFIQMGFYGIDIDLTGITSKDTAEKIISKLEKYPLLAVKTADGIISTIKKQSIELSNLMSIEENSVVIDLIIPESLSMAEIRQYMKQLPVSNTIIFHSDDAKKLVEGATDIQDKVLFTSLLNILKSFGKTEIITTEQARKLAYAWKVSNLPEDFYLEDLIKGDLPSSELFKNSAIYEEASDMQNIEIRKAFLQAIAERMLIRNQLAQRESEVEGITEAYRTGMYKIDSRYEEKLGNVLLNLYLENHSIPIGSYEKMLNDDATVFTIIDRLNREGNKTAVADIIMFDIITDWRSRNIKIEKDGSLDEKLIEDILSAA